ncbi:MAG TPA: histidine kinase [Flavitalea sp.]|nr:histidine kinase [Flavitalea sp.]
MNKPWYSWKVLKILLHVAVWVLLFSLPYLLRPEYNEQQPPKDDHRSGINTSYLINNALWVALFYLNAYVLIPMFIYRKKYYSYALWVTTVFIVYLLFGWLSFILMQPDRPFNIRPHILFTFFIFLFIMASSTAYQMIVDKVRNDRLANEKENENLKTELSLLRSQVSPHFMFNVLNNMVALARKQSDQLESSLIKLSSLMRYMLYEADEDKVSLDKEIEYLNSYIDLQQQRFGKKILLNVSFEKSDGRHQIEPMLLIPFVENAFKHGTGMIDNAQIDIHLTLQADELHFTVGNRYNNNSVEMKDKTSGIGLTNVTRRLNLLYGKAHKLQITKKEDWFIVSLQLTLR